METNLLDRMLDAYLSDQTPVTLTLQNKIRVVGKIKTFDSYVIVMEGPKQEILYRHAVSSMAPYIEEQKRPPVQSRPAPQKTAARPQKNSQHKPRPAHQQPALSAASGEASINSGMKDGLMKWMQEQKAAK